jgi:hypothetical protein
MSESHVVPGPLVDGECGLNIELDCLACLYRFEIAKSTTNGHVRFGSILLQKSLNGPVRSADLVSEGGHRAAGRRCPRWEWRLLTFVLS